MTRRPASTTNDLVMPEVSELVMLVLTMISLRCSIRRRGGAASFRSPSGGGSRRGVRTGRRLAPSARRPGAACRATARRGMQRVLQIYDAPAGCAISEKRQCRVRIWHDDAGIRTRRREGLAAFLAHLVEALEELGLDQHLARL